MSAAGAEAAVSRRLYEECLPRGRYETQMIDLCPCRFPGRFDSREIFDFPAEAWMTENECIV